MSTIDPGEALRTRVLGFFANNPDESLTAADISRKFSVGIRLVPEALIPAVAAGNLRLNSHGDYSAGRAPARNTAPAATATATPAKRRSSAELPPLPPAAALRVEPGIPLPDRPKPKGLQSPYTPIFQAMNAGDSVALPTDAARRLIGSAQHLGKKLGRKYIHRQLGNGQSRIWRTE